MNTTHPATWRRTELLTQARDCALEAFQTWATYLDVLRSFGCSEPADYALLQQWQRLRIELSVASAAIDEVLVREARHDA